MFVSFLAKQRKLCVQRHHELLTVPVWLLSQAASKYTAFMFPQQVFTKDLAHSDIILIWIFYLFKQQNVQSQ